MMKNLTKYQLVEFLDSKLSKETKLRICEMYIKEEEFSMIFSIENDIKEFKRLGYEVIKVNWERMSSCWTYYVGNHNSEMYKYYEKLHKEKL